MAFWMVKRREINLEDITTFPDDETEVLIFTSNGFDLAVIDTDDNTWLLRSGSFFEVQDSDEWWPLPDSVFPTTPF